MGKKSAQKANTALDAQSQVAGKQADLAERLVDESSPARMQALNTYQGVAAGNQPGIQKYVAPQINAATQQFYLARKAVESMGPGGMRDQAMKDINLQEAGAKTQIYSGGVSDALARAATMGMSGSTAGQSGYGTAGSMYGSVGQTYNDMATSKGGMASKTGTDFGGMAAML
jgi:hypothetical protein